MKRQFVFFSLITFTISVVACKKDKQFKPEEVRLVGADVYSDNGVQHEIIDYNADGKITKISFQFNNDAPKTRFDVSYSGNEIIIVEPPVINNATELRDTVRLQLNPNGTISKRIHSSFFEVKPPTADCVNSQITSMCRCRPCSSAPWSIIDVRGSSRRPISSMRVSKPIQPRGSRNFKSGRSGIGRPLTA